MSTVYPSSPDLGTLLATLLREQSELTQSSVVERFAELKPSQGRGGTYKDLIPLSAPRPGEQLSFEVDLDLCSSCKSCVSACHQLNGTDPGESWRRVGSLESTKGPYIQALSSACHHCLEPACLRGCPVQAYEKDPLSGIVRHLDDQCIGCQYCMMTCPYDVPQYNPRLGIVRKCDMCSQRLEQAEAPACAQACPTEAISIKTINVATLKTELEEEKAGALPLYHIDPQITRPTTHYKSRRALSELRDGGETLLRPEPAHWPLVAMLVLSQWAVGLYAIDALLLRIWPGSPPAARGPILAGGLFLLTVLALGIGTLHLGRPLWAFRAVLGLRTSWMSREIVIFGCFAGLASLLALFHWPASGLSNFLSPSQASLLEALLLISGGLGVLSSIMIYAVTRRSCWNLRRTSSRFLGTALILGGATVLMLWIAPLLASGLAPTESWKRLAFLALVTGLLAGLKLLGEILFLRHGRNPADPVLQRSVALLLGPLRRWQSLRLLFGGGGTLCFLALAYLLELKNPPELIVALAGAGLILLLGGELMERILFFRGVAYPRMPGASA